MFDSILMIPVLASQIFIVVMIVASLIVLFLELINFLLIRNKSKINYSLNFIKWAGLFFIVFLVISSSWDLLVLRDLHFSAEQRLNSMFWLFDFATLLTALLFSQLLWMKAVNKTRVGRIGWCLIILFVVLLSPFIDVLFFEYEVWFHNEAKLYLNNSKVNNGSNAAGMTLTSSRNLYLPSFILFIAIIVLAITISNRGRKNHSNQ